MSCGIYKWTSPNGKSYIGQSVNLEKRYYEFLYNKHYSTSNDYKKLTVIDKARKKHPDFEQWTYEILEYCKPNELNDREQYYINLFDTFKNGYNETSGGGQNFEISDETRKKMSDSHKGKTPSDETKEKIRQVRIGKTQSDEAKEKMRQAHIGKTLSDEHKEKIRQVRIGKTQSDETKEKISKGNKGKTPWNKGKTQSDETKDKIGKANAKQVDQYSLDGTFIKTFPSTMQVQRELGFANNNIGACCNGKQKTSNGFIWRYHN